MLDEPIEIVVDERWRVMKLLCRCSLIHYLFTCLICHIFIFIFIFIFSNPTSEIAVAVAVVDIVVFPGRTWAVISRVGAIESTLECLFGRTRRRRFERRETLRLLQRLCEALIRRDLEKIVG